MHSIVKEMLDIQVVKLRLAEKVEEGLSRVEGTK